MKITVETITPEQAAEMLANNPSNRNLRRNVVMLYARDMARGRWQMNGDAIRLNEDGSLIDGQHRLSACVRSGVPLHSVVIRGLPSDVRDTVDGGAKRSHGDRLAMRGIANASHVSACARILFGLASGEGLSARSTPQDLDAIISKHPDFLESVKRMNKVFIGMDSQLSAFHYIAVWRGEPDRADALREVWRAGIPDYDGDPMHAIRERIIRTAQATQSLTKPTVLRLMCRAFPAFMNSEPLRVVKPVDKIGVAGWTLEVAGAA